MRARTLAPLWLAAAGLTGCIGATLKTVEPGEDGFIANDARLRIVTNKGIGPFSRPGLVDPNQIVCVEPSPDVATAVATSTSAAVNALTYGNAALTSQTVEALAQLTERTAAIQVLRDKMYQTCLAYQNGAITGTDYSLTMARLDETIVALVFGESAAGRFGASLASLGGEAEGAAQAVLAGLPDQVQDVDAQVQAVAAANEKVKTAQTAKDEYLKANPTPDQARVAELSKAITDAETERDNLIKSLRRAASASAEGAARFAKISGVGGIDETANPLVAAELTEMLDYFVNNDWAKYYISACVVELARPTDAHGDGSKALLERDYQLLLEREELNLAALNRIDAQLATSSAPADKARLTEQRKSLEATGSRIAQAIGTLRAQLDKGEPEQRIVDAYFEAFESELNEQTPNDKILTNAVAAVNLTRRSALATHCEASLGLFIHDAHVRQMAYRTRRTELEAEAATIAAKARVLEAAESWLEASREELAACGTRYPAPADAEKLKACTERVEKLYKYLGGS